MGILAQIVNKIIFWKIINAFSYLLRTAKLMKVSINAEHAMKEEVWRRKRGILTVHFRMILNVLSFQQIIRLPAFSARKIIIWMKSLENALMLKKLLLNASSMIPKSNAQNVCKIIFYLMIKKLVFYKRIKSMTQIALLLIKP